jgi:hypothetical protein
VVALPQRPVEQIRDMENDFRRCVFRVVVIAVVIVIHFIVILPGRGRAVSSVVIIGAAGEKKDHTEDENQIPFLVCNMFHSLKLPSDSKKINGIPSKVIFVD